MRSILVWTMNEEARMQLWNLYWWTSMARFQLYNMMMCLHFYVFV